MDIPSGFLRNFLSAFRTVPFLHEPKRPQFPPSLKVCVHHERKTFIEVRVPFRVVGVRSRTIAWHFYEKFRFFFVPSFHGLDGRDMSQGFLGDVVIVQPDVAVVYHPFCKFRLAPLAGSARRSV